MWQDTHYKNITPVHVSCAVKIKLLKSGNQLCLLLQLSLQKSSLHQPFAPYRFSLWCLLLVTLPYVSEVRGSICKSVTAIANKQLIIFLLDTFSVYRGLQLVRHWHHVVLGTMGWWWWQWNKFHVPENFITASVGC